MRFVFWKAFWGLVLYDTMQVQRELAHLHRVVRDWPVRRQSVLPNAAAAVCDALNQACIWYPKRVRCLQRSVVTTCLLRSYGVSAQMVVGARTIPFKAHAWTEIDGKAINERRDVQHLYQVLERC